MAELLTVKDLLQRTTDFFAKKGVPTPKIDAEWLLAAALCCKRLQLFLDHERLVPEATLVTLRGWVKRRGEREPLQQILGSTEWAGLKLTVTKDVLCPRHETEDLWDKIVVAHTATPPATILDLGTGSGALALALKKSFPTASVTAIDRSTAALTVAKANALANGLEVNFIEGNWAHGLAQKFDLIVSNPPYLTEEEWAAAEPEVRLWEPKGALTAPDAGFADIAEIMRQARPLLTAGGSLWLETGIAHQLLIKDLATQLAYASAEVYKDAHGRARFAQVLA